MIDDDLEIIKILSLFENWGPISDQKKIIQTRKRKYFRNQCKKLC